MTNTPLPQFSNINIKAITKDLDAMLTTHLTKINTLLQDNTRFDWDNLMQPLDNMDNELTQFWSPISHLHAVKNTPVLRKAYEACLPILSAYESKIGQNKALYNAIKSMDESTMNAAQKKIVADALRHFKLSGVHLDPDAQKQLEVINARLSSLANQFENNILDATHNFEYVIHDPKQLEGLPHHTIEKAKQLATDKNISGWILNLETPCYIAIMTYAKDRALRESFYHAYSTRASELGPKPEAWDNTPIIEELLKLKHEKSQLLGFANSAERSLATKMAQNPNEVLVFLNELQKRAKPQAKAEFSALQDYCTEQHGPKTLEPWDIAFYSEQKKQTEYAISQEQLRPFFPVPKVLTGLFHIIQALYGMHAHALKHVDCWHPDVLCYELIDEENNTRGFIYLDLFARPHKRSGAWMDDCQGRMLRDDGSIQAPIAFLTCNFTNNQTVEKPATLSHDEVLTLFHEFGHCLQHVLTQVDYLSASGIRGVEWDAVELPSQFFENWCWEPSILPLLTEHIETKESLDESTIKKLIDAKNFQSAMGLLRQVEFSCFDFRIHLEYNPELPHQWMAILDDVRNTTSVVPIKPFNRFAQSFSHIFAGGYGAGYYSYKWAEVLSCDAFSRFKTEGLLNPKTGRDFLHCILETGSTKTTTESYLNFRGKMPSVDALLAFDGIA